MIMIQDDPMPTGADKPLRITGDPHKVQVGLRKAQCVLLSFQFTLYFTHFMPSIVHSNLKTSVFIDRTPAGRLLFFFQCSILCYNQKDFDVSFIASP